jgi:hypothetical protein
MFVNPAFESLLQFGKNSIVDEIFSDSSTDSEFPPMNSSRIDEIHPADNMESIEMSCFSASRPRTEKELLQKTMQHRPTTTNMCQQFVNTQAHTQNFTLCQHEDKNCEQLLLVGVAAKQPPIGIVDHRRPSQARPQDSLKMYSCCIRSEPGE